MPFSSPGHCQAGPGVLRTPQVSLSPSQAETVMHPTRYGTRYPPKPVPFLCSSPRCMLVKFQPHPVPRCSIQASVSCPSHPFACRLPPRRRVVLLHRSIAINAAEPAQCQCQAPGNNASCSTSASSFHAGTASSPVYPPAP
jgi:hypothetical protein